MRVGSRAKYMSIFNIVDNNLSTKLISVVYLVFGIAIGCEGGGPHQCLTTRTEAQAGLRGKEQRSMA